MRRRELLFSGASLVLSSIAEAHSSHEVKPLVAYLTAAAQAPRVSLLAAFSRGMKAIFVNLNDPGAAFQMQSVGNVAKQLGVELAPVVDVSSLNDLELAFERAKLAGAAGALRMVDPLEAAFRTRTLELAVKHHLPMMYAFREAVEVGGLISYGASQPDLYRQAAALVLKILNGEKPADLPVERRPSLS